MNSPWNSIVRSASALALIVLTTACSSPLAQRAQRADGLLGFIFDSPGPDVVPVERVSKGGGLIVTAHATPADGGLRVGGIVRKAPIVQSVPGSHVDVFVLNARGQISSAVATDYFPRPLAHPSSRYGPGNSHYGVRLPAIPPAGSTVRVVFHGIAKAQCELSAGT